MDSNTGRVITPCAEIRCNTPRVKSTRPVLYMQNRHVLDIPDRVRIPIHLFNLPKTFPSSYTFPSTPLTLLNLSHPSTSLYKHHQPPPSYSHFFTLHPSILYSLYHFLILSVSKPQHHHNMVRTRGVDRSKQQKTRGTSSPPGRLIPSGPGQSSAATPPPPHPLSQFGSGEQKERYQVLSTLPIHPNYIFRVEELNKIGLGESVMHIIRTSKWDRFVQIEEPSYNELLL